MNISQTENGTVTIVRIEGNLDTNTAPMALETLRRLTEAGVQGILIDFEALDYISSAGLHVLLITAKNLRGSGGNFRICSLNDTVAEVFKISGFDNLLSVFPSQAQALDGW